MATWQGDPDKPVVSICCITYNHELYIEDALEGFLIQETDFPFEIIIHDDASTDRTADIIREYEAKYPKLIKPIYQKENQYSKEGFKFFFELLKSCNGEYIALCEGDDYWIDPKKLQVQIKYMQDHPGCSMTFHASNYVDAISSQLVKRHRNDTRSRSFSMDELILGGGGLVATQSIVFRSIVVRQPPDFLINAPVGDYPLVLAARLSGDVHYLDFTGSVYRMNNPISAMGKAQELSPALYVYRYSKIAAMLNEFNLATHGSYRRYVRLKSSQIILFSLLRAYKQLRFSQRKKLLQEYGNCLIVLHRLAAAIFIIPFMPDIFRVCIACRRFVIGFLKSTYRHTPCKSNRA
ncbi:glycosyltransferase [Desulfurispirillum indicum]|uniref:glycosyltransferase n=1 Tax=Desulfurispirillum indicum TaxID=936456 RepID=UPI001CFBA0E0|nr:glycosyltransferase [Desulfurispirillum indicum]UCZ56529.1 glycosyltransferase [Desulfurispirillum indicum]